MVCFDDNEWSSCFKIYLFFDVDDSIVYVYIVADGVGGCFFLQGLYGFQWVVVGNFVQFGQFFFFEVESDYLWFFLCKWVGVGFFWQSLVGSQGFCFIYISVLYVLIDGVFGFFLGLVDVVFFQVINFFLLGQLYIVDGCDDLQVVVQYFEDQVKLYLIIVCICIVVGYGICVQVVGVFDGFQCLKYLFGIYVQWVGVVVQYVVVNQVVQVLVVIGG